MDEKAPDTRVLKNHLGLPDVPDSSGDMGMTGDYVPSLSSLLIGAQPASKDFVSGQPHLGTTVDAVVMFIDISSFTRISRKLRPSEVGYWVNRLFAQLGTLCRQYAATLDKVLGDGMLILLSQNLGCQTPLLNSVNIAKSIMRLNVHGYGMHFGIASGPIWIGFTGPIHEMSVSAMGSTVNLAARLAEASGKDGIAMPQNDWDAVSRLVGVDSASKSKPKLSKSTVHLHDVSEFQPEAQQAPLRGFEELNWMVLRSQSEWIAPFEKA